MLWYDHQTLSVGYTIHAFENFFIAPSYKINYCNNFLSFYIPS